MAQIFTGLAFTAVGLSLVIFYWELPQSVPLAVKGGLATLFIAAALLLSVVWRQQRPLFSSLLGLVRRLGIRLDGIGRPGAGTQRAGSHSGALAGPDEAVSAFFSHHGIIRVDTLEALLETPHLVTGLKPASGRRAAVMTTTGGGAAMVVDRLGLAGVSFASPPAQVKERLGALDIPVGDSPVVDLTMAGARADVYGPVLGDLIDDKGNDVVVCVVGSSAQFRPDVAVRPIIEQGRSEKPLAVFCVPEAGESLKALSAAGIAGFRTPESCADAVSAYLHWSGPVAIPKAGPAPVPPPPVQSLLQEANRSRLDEAASLGVFEALGIACVPRHVDRKSVVQGKGVAPGGRRIIT